MSRSLAGLNAILPPGHLDRAREASGRLRMLGVPHAIVGGLAVGAHGWARMTKDVDILVQSGEDLASLFLGSSKPLALPEDLQGRSAIEHGTEIDILAPVQGESLEVLDAALERNVSVVGGLPILDIGPLVLMKMASGRARDGADIVEMLKASDNLEQTVGEVGDYLEENAPDAMEDFDSYIAQATWEQRVNK